MRFDEARIDAVASCKNSELKDAAAEIYKANKTEWKSGGDTLKNNIKGQFIVITAHEYLREKRLIEILTEVSTK